MNRRRLLALASTIGLTLFVSAPRSAAADEKEADRIHNSAQTLKEILDVPENIPQDLLDKARCVVVIPSVVKAAFIVGGSYGRGVMVCRTGREFTGAWGAPVMMALEAGSVGFQIGGQATDFVILIMNNRGVESLLHNKVKLGADASIAAGPKGRDAQAAVDAAFRAEMLSYSRSRGAFAGVSLEGATLRPDNDANRRLYGKEVSAPDIVTESRVPAPEAAHELDATLEKASAHLKP
jgi:SH3 domain-containing YSC84-like protein 1